MCPDLRAGEGADGLGEDSSVCPAAAAEDSPEEGGGARAFEGRPRGGAGSNAGAVRAGEIKLIK